MKKIVILVDNLEIGGTATILNEYLKIPPFNKYEIQVFSYFKPRKFEQIEGVKYKWLFNFYGYKYINIFIPLLFNFTPLSALLHKKLIKTSPNIVICFSEYTGLIKLLYNFDGKKISWIHSGAKNYDHTYNGLFNFEKYLNFYDEIICVSNDVKEELLNKYKILSNVHTIFNPINENEILDKSMMINIKFTGKNVVIVGRVTYEKGMDRLIEISKFCQNITFHVLGSGNYMSKIKGISNIKSYGNVENPFPYISNSDCLLILSRLEGLPTTAIEAAILGTAVLSVPVQGVNDISSIYDNLKIMTYNPHDFANYLIETEFNNTKIIWNEKINIEEIEKIVV